MKRKTGVIQAAIFLAIVVGLTVPGLAFAQKGEGGGKGKKPPNPSVEVRFLDDENNMRIRSDGFRVNDDGFGVYEDGEDGAGVVFSEASGGALVINLYGSDSRYINLDFFKEAPPDGNEYLPPPNYYCPYFLDKSGNFQSGHYRGVYAVVQGVKGVPIYPDGWESFCGQPDNMCGDDGDSHWVLRRATFNLETIKGDYEQLRFRINPKLEENYEIDPLLQATAYVRVQHIKDGNEEDVWIISPETNPPLNERVANLAGVALIDKKTRNIEPCALFLMPFYLEARLK